MKIALNLSVKFFKIVKRICLDFWSSTRTSTQSLVCLAVIWTDILAPSTGFPLTLSSPDPGFSNSKEPRATDRNGVRERDGDGHRGGHFSPHPRVLPAEWWRWRHHFQQVYHSAGSLTVKCTAWSPECCWMMTAGLPFVSSRMGKNALRREKPSLASTRYFFASSVFLVLPFLLLHMTDEAGGSFFFFLHHCLVHVAMGRDRSPARRPILARNHSRLCSEKFC